VSCLDSTFALIARVRRGDSEALERLLARHLGPFAVGSAAAGPASTISRGSIIVVAAETIAVCPAAGPIASLVRSPGRAFSRQE
jgi:hypothetical protein